MRVPHGDIMIYSSTNESATWGHYDILHHYLTQCHIGTYNLTLTQSGDIMIYYTTNTVSHSDIRYIQPECLTKRQPDGKKCE